MPVWLPQRSAGGRHGALDRSSRRYARACLRCRSAVLSRSGGALTLIPGGRGPRTLRRRLLSLEDACRTRWRRFGCRFRRMLRRSWSRASPTALTAYGMPRLVLMHSQCRHGPGCGRSIFDLHVPPVKACCVLLHCSEKHLESSLTRCCSSRQGLTWHTCPGGPFAITEQPRSQLSGGQARHPDFRLSRRLTRVPVRAAGRAAGVTSPQQNAHAGPGSLCVADPSSTGDEPCGRWPMHTEGPHDHSNQYGNGPAHYPALDQRDGKGTGSEEGAHSAQRGSHACVLNACCEDHLLLECACETRQSPDDGVQLKEDTSGAAHRRQNATDGRRHIGRPGTCSETCQGVQACGADKEVNRTLHVLSAVTPPPPPRVVSCCVGHSHWRCLRYSCRLCCSYRSLNAILPVVSGSVRLALWQVVGG